MTYSLDNSKQSSIEATACFKLQTGHVNCHAEFYPQQYQLLLKGTAHEEKVDLGYAGSKLLERLIQSPGEVIPREELLTHAWSDRVVGQGSLNQQIYTLRQLLGDEKKREIIQTLPRRGYLFNPQSLIQEAPEQVLESATNPSTATSYPLTKGAGKYLNHLLIASNLALAIFLMSNSYKNFLPDAQASSQQGLLHIHYIASSVDELKALQKKTTNLSLQLNQMATREGHLYLSQVDDQLELQCIDPHKNQRWLKIDSRQLDNLPESLLQRCLQ